MKAPISSKKNIVQHTQFVVNSGTVTTLTDVNAVAVANVTNSGDIEEGSLVKAIFIELWLLSDTTEISSFVVIVEKAPLGHSGPLIAQMTTLNSYFNKKNVLFTSQGLLAGGQGSSSGNPTPVLRQWIKIPKGKQRFGLDDHLNIAIAGIGAADIEGCGLTIFKSYQ